MTTPSTEAGRRLDHMTIDNHLWVTIHEAVVAIETEAAEAALAALRERMEGLRDDGQHADDRTRAVLDAVLALIDEPKA